MLTKYNTGDKMEEWKKSVYVGVILMALGAAFAVIRKEITIWTILIFILAIADIAIGLYRKKRGM